MYLAAGFNDGALCLLDLSAHKGQSYRRPIFKTSSDGDEHEGNQQNDPYTQFQETSFEHSDTIVSVEINPMENSLLLSASKDGGVFVWRV